MGFPLANPVHGPIHPLGWARPAGNVEFALTRGFGDRSVMIGGVYPAHNGIDIANGRVGDSVLAADGGRVEYADADPASGGAKIVIVNFGNNYRAWVAHLAIILASIRTNVLVGRGAQLGTHDTTGWATGPHIHFQLQHLVSGRWIDIDPWPLLAQNAPPAAIYVKVVGPGVFIRLAPVVDPTNVYKQSTAAGYLLDVKMKLDPAKPYVAGGTYRIQQSNGTVLVGSTWARVWLNGAYRFVAKPLIKRA